MKIAETSLPGVLIVEPKAFSDERGMFMEVHHAKAYAEAGIVGPFVQDNFSRSVKNTLRGLHFQEPRPQGKLVQVLRGAVWDVAVDIRRGSPTFARWFGLELTAGDRRQLWIPPGFAHGFCVLTDEADFFYKCTEVYAPECDRSLAWNDPQIDIQWPIAKPLLSKKDLAAPRLADAPALPA